MIFLSAIYDMYSRTAVTD